MQPSSGLCDDGDPRTSDDQDVCLPDGSCMQGTGPTTYACEHVETDVVCIIAGTCYAAGVVNPANRCQACQPDLDESACSQRAVGSVCGDPTNSACSAPDTCDAAGVCQANHASPGGPCGDPSPRIVATGWPCGSGATTACTAPDTCAAAGARKANHVANNTECGAATHGVCQGGSQDVFCLHPRIGANSQVPYSI